VTINVGKKVTDNLQKIIINNNEFIRKFNILNNEDRLLLKKDIDWELTNRPCTDSSIPPYQTHSDLFHRYKNNQHWQNLHKAFSEISGNLVLSHTWANLSNEDNRYQWHDHKDLQLTCVYYLISPFPEFGTKIENGVIIEAVENSILFFNGSIVHSVANMPSVIGKFNHRYSVVFDYK
jgi:hypothetical protein